MVAALDNKTQQYLKDTEHIIKAEVNVKEVALLPPDSNIIVKEVKPNYRVLGPKLGKKIKQVGKLLKELSQEQIKQLEQTGKIEFEIDGEKITLTTNDVEILSKDIPGWKVASDGKITIALDVEINEDLYLEGIARDLINRIQNLRKETGLEITDRIILTLTKNELVEKVLEKFEDYIKQEVLAEKIILTEEKQQHSFEIEKNIFYLNLSKT